MNIKKQDKALEKFIENLIEEKGIEFVRQLHTELKQATIMFDASKMTLSEFVNIMENKQ